MGETKDETIERWSTKNISDEKIKSITDKLKSGMKKVDIAESVGISYVTVYRYAKKLGYVKCRGDKEVTEPLKQTKNLTESKPLEEHNNRVLLTTKRETLECALIKDRHTGIPTDKYIFSSINQQIMFNYKRLDDIVKKFIISNMEFVSNESGIMVGSKDLVVYVTGLACTQASVLKVCQELRVNLTLMHWNKRSKQYFPQVIWKDFGRHNIRSIFPLTDNICMRCTYKDLEANEFYYTSVVDDGYKDNIMRMYESITICKSEEDMWNQYGAQFSELMPDKNAKKIIRAFKAKLKSDGMSKQCLYQMSTY